MPVPKPCASWPSPIGADALVSGFVMLSELRADAERLYWLESRPTEGGRNVLVTKGSASDGCREITPSPFDVRTRVHEYGGGAYALDRGSVHFVNFADQNVYTIDRTGEIRAITQSDSSTRFADLCADPLRNRLLCVCEEHSVAREARNRLVAIDLADGSLKTVHEGHDFYAAPTLDAEGRRLAFLAWDHPNMPWDGTLLMSALLDGAGHITELGLIAGGAGESVLQPTWADARALLYLSDRNGYWNLYRHDASGDYCVLEDGADYAGPPWVLGLRDFAPLDDRHVLVARLEDRGHAPALVDTLSCFTTPLDHGALLRYRDSLCHARGKVYCVASDCTTTPVIEALDVATQTWTTVHAPSAVTLDAPSISRGEAITYPTRDGARAHAYFYAPASIDYAAPPGERPPLLVIGHGGPTAAARNVLNLRIQYYTSRGWAVLDVNYRGSSGFGRAYRSSLAGRWGVRDVEDCEDAVRHLVAQNRVDAHRVAIRGGSAGGYTTLAALTNTRTFGAGACHYGIGDLRALERDTHKFESRYLHALVPSDAMEERSPIHHVERIECPVIFFQGSDDRVVPANQTRAMASALREKGLPVAYVEFAGEGHGFRRAENVIRAQETEYAFFCRVFGIAPAEDVEIEVENVERLGERR